MLRVIVFSLLCNELPSVFSISVIRPTRLFARNVAMLSASAFLLRFLVLIEIKHLTSGFRLPVVGA